MSKNISVIDIDVELDMIFNLPDQMVRDAIKDLIARQAKEAYKAGYISSGIEDLTKNK